MHGIEEARLPAPVDCPKALLLVDDQRSVCDGLRRILHRDGYDIHAATSADQAMVILKQRPIDVVISDQRMPVKTGTVFLKEVKDLYPRTVRMILSGAAEIGDVAAAMDAGAIHKFLTKPIDPALLRANVREAFSRAAAMRPGDGAGPHLFDATTELPTRSYLKDAFGAQVAESRAAGQSICLFMLKVDQHQSVISSFGRSVSDEFLRAVARNLTRGLGVRCLLSHDSPGTFLILTADEDPVDRIERMNCQLDELFAAPMSVVGCRITVTVSVGATVADERSQFDALVDEAHAAMMTGSQRGGATVQLFKPELVNVFRGQLELESDLRQAVMAQSFRVYYQPQVDVKIGKIAGVEALLRWPHPHRGFVSPKDFIPLAERLGLIREIGAWVLETAVADLLSWRRAGLALDELAINVSPHQMKDSSFVDTVASVLERAKLPAHNLVLEITESAAIEQAPAIVECLDGLRNLGVTLAIDDFGTGYANLSNLTRFSFRKLKIDRSLLPSQDDRSRKLFANVVAMARELGVTVVAEGVETANELAAVYAGGCSLVQGYFFSGGVSSEKLGELLRDIVAHMEY